MDDPDIYDFTLHGIDTSMSNSIRRILLSQIPSIAIENVCIIENDSVLADEKIAQRLGLIPLKKTDTSTEINISLNVTGPKKIYSKDLCIDKGVKLVNDNIIILELKKGQNLKLTGKIEEGIGKDHAKWSVCCGVSCIPSIEYKNSSDFHIETNGSISAKEAFKLAVEILRDELIDYKKML